MILAPLVLCSEKFKENIDISAILEEYGEDLINRDVVDQELLPWQRSWLAVASKDRPDTLPKAITKCDEERFPNLFVLLKIACTFPITSAECECSFSAMRRLRTWLRATMKMERLGLVAIMNIHRQEDVDYKHVSKLFFQLHPRKINLTNLLFDWIFWNLKKWTFWFIAILKIHHYNFIKLCKLFFVFICFVCFKYNHSVINTFVSEMLLWE